LENSCLFNTVFSDPTFSIKLYCILTTVIKYLFGYVSCSLLGAVILLTLFRFIEECRLVGRETDGSSLFLDSECSDSTGDIGRGLLPNVLDGLSRLSLDLLIEIVFKDARLSSFFSDTNSDDFNV